MLRLLLACADDARSEPSTQAAGWSLVRLIPQEYQLWTFKAFAFRH